MHKRWFPNSMRQMFSSNRLRATCVRWKTDLILPSPCSFDPSIPSSCENGTTLQPSSAQWLTMPPARPPRGSKHPPCQHPNCPLVRLAGCRWVEGKHFTVHSRWSPRQSPSSQCELLEASPVSQPHWDWSLPADRRGAQSLLPHLSKHPTPSASADVRHEWGSSISSGTLPNHPGRRGFAQIKKRPWQRISGGIFSQIWCKYCEQILYIEHS